MKNAPELYALFEHSPDAIFIEDFEGNVLDANRRACELHGYSKEELVGKNVLELVPPDYRDYVSQDLPRWISGDLIERTGVSYTREGQQIYVELRGQRVTYQGQPALMLVARDITKRLDMQEALIASEKRFRQMVEHAPEALMLLNLETGLLVEVNKNAEQLFGRTREDLLQRGPIDLSPEYQPDGSRSDVRAMEMIGLAGYDRPVVFEWEHLHASGNPVPCEVRLLKLENNGQTLLRGSISNISKQRQIQLRADELHRQLERARRMETAGLLAGGVAHDLNNILGPMVAYPDLLLDDVTIDSETRLLVEEIQASAERAASIIQELLILARRGDIQTEPLDLSNLISGYLKTPELRHVLNERPGIRLQYKQECKNPTINGSSSHIIRLAMNLVLNGIQAMGSEGCIKVSTRNENLERPFIGYEQIPPGHYVVLEVSDEGHGIPGDQLEHIFDPFFSGKKKNGSNSGLGLAVVYGVIRDHGGYINVTSQPGIGTQFNIFFPVEKAVVSAKPSRSSGLVSASGQALVVDDVKEQRELASQLLERLGMEVTTVDNGRAAVDLISERKFDLVLLDMVMEDDFDGLDTYLDIHERSPHTPCLIASGYAETQRIKMALMQGAGPHLKKPYNLAQLSAAVDAVIHRDALTTNAQPPVPAQPSSH